MKIKSVFVYVYSIVASSVFGADGTWTAMGNGAWSQSANWLSGVVASGVGNKAYFSSSASAITVTNDLADLRVQALMFNGGDYQVVGLPITVEGATSGDYGVNVLAGTARVTTPLSINRHTQMVVQDLATLTLDGMLTYVTDKGLWTAKKGNGTLAIAHTFVMTNDCNFGIQGGLVRLCPNARFLQIRGVVPMDRYHLMVGYSGGPGVLLLETNSTMQVESFMVGRDANGFGRMLVDGGSCTAWGSLESGVLVGERSPAELIVTRGGSVTISNYLHVGAFSAGSLIVTNAGSLSAGVLVLGERGSFSTNDLSTGISTVRVSAATVDVKNQLYWRYGKQYARTNTVVVSEGGLLIVPATDAPVAAGAATGGNSQLLLRDGTLKLSGMVAGGSASLTNYLNDLSSFYLGNGRTGVNVDGFDCQIAQPLLTEPGTSMLPTTTFAKTGTGTLALQQGIVYSGLVSIVQGTLKIAGMNVPQWCALSGGARLDVADGVCRTMQLEVFHAGLERTSECVVDIGAAGVSDQLYVKAPVFGAITWVLRSLGAASGSYTLLRYEGDAPSLEGWRVVAPAGLTATLSLDTANRSVVAVCAPTAADDDAVWLSSGSGTWTDASNWNHLPVTTATFSNAVRQDLSATLTTSVLLDKITVQTPYTVTLQGGDLTVGELAIQSGKVLLATPVSGRPSILLSGGGVCALAQGSLLTSPLTINGSKLEIPDQLVNQPLTIGARGATLQIPSASAITVATSIAGSGMLQKPGSNILTLSDTSTFTGSYQVGAGTLALSALSATGGDLVLGPGSLVYSGASTTSARNLVIATSDRNDVGTLVLTNDLTLTGTFNGLTGGFLKLGPGKLTLNGTGSQALLNAKVERDPSYCINRDAFGNSPTRGLRMLNIAEGTLEVGNVNQSFDWTQEAVIVGAETAVTGQTERAAHLIINSNAAIRCGYLSIGRGNGQTSTAPTPLTSSVTINGGSIQASGIWLGTQLGDMSDCTAQPLLTIQGGGITTVVVRCGSGLNNKTKNRIVLNGGSLVITGDKSAESPLIHAGGGETTLTLTGGSMSYTKIGLQMTDVWAGTNCSATVLLNGGELAALGWSKGGGLARFIFDGGTLRLLTNAVLTELTETRVGRGGARLAAEGSVTVTAPLTHDTGLGETPDGGVTWFGTGSLILAGTNTYTGPTTIQSGSLRIAGPLAKTDIRILGNGRFSLMDGTITVFACDALSCAQNGCIDLEVGDRVVLPTSMTGNLRFALFASGSTARYVKAGRVAVASCAAATLDVSGWQLEGLPQARFSFENNTVYVTVGTSEVSASEWLNPAGGAWSTASNWSDAPNDSVETDVYFGSAVTQATVIAVDRAVTVGSLVLDTPQACTFSGQSLSLGDATHTGMLYSSAGIQTFTSTVLAPLAGAVNLQSNSVIYLNGGFQGAVDVRGGRVVVTNAASSGTLSLNASTLDLPESRVLGFQLAISGSAVITQQASRTTIFTQAITGSGQLDKWGTGFLFAPAFQGRLHVNRGWMAMESLPGALMIGSASFGYTGAGAGTLTNGYRVMTELPTQAAVFSNDADVVVSGAVTVERGAFVKLGAGTLTYAGAGNNILSQGDNAATGSGRLMLSADGSSPTQGYRSYSIYKGRVILGAEGQTNAFAQAVIVGGQTTTNAGAETAAELIIQGGVVTNADYFALGRGNGTSITAPTGLVSRMVVNGGLLFSKGLYMGARLNDMSEVNARPEYIHNSGTHVMYDRIQMGDAGGSSRPRVVVNGGTILHTGGTQIVLAGGAGCVGELTLSGGTLVSSNTLYLVRDCPGQATIHLNSGRLNVGNLAADRATNGLAVVNFNGATLGFCMPWTSTVSGVHQLNVREGGAKIDVVQGAAIIITNVMQSGVSSGTDGGLVKMGAGVLALQASPAYSGTTSINEGLFSLTAPCTMPSDLFFASGTTLRVRATAEQWLASTTTAVLNVTGNLQFSEGVAVELLAWDYNSVPNTKGTYRVVACSGTITLPQGGLAATSGLLDRSYTFSVAEDGKTLLMTIGDPVQTTTWKNTQGGLWSAAANWHVAPDSGAENMIVGFNDSIITDAVIAVDQAFTAGHLRFNSSKAYTLVGTEGARISGTNTAVSVLKGRANIGLPMQLDQTLSVAVNSNSVVQFEGALSGQGSILKEGNSGELALLGSNTYAGGTVVNGSGVLVDVGGVSPLGTGAVTLNQWGSLRTLQAPAAISNSVVFTDDWYLTTPATLVLGGAWTSRNDGRLIKQGSGELVIAGRIQPGSSSKARLNVREGSVRLAAGAEVTLTNAAVRDVLTFETPSAGADYRAVVMEPGSKMTATCLWMGGNSKTNVVEVNQAELYLPGYANTNGPDALVLTPGGNSSNLCSLVVNGGALVTGDAGWVVLGANQGNSRLVINNGSASLGQVSFGLRDTLGYTFSGVQADITVVSNGSLVVRNRLNWNGWNASDRVNTLALNGGFAALPPTFAVPTNAGLSQVVFNGGTVSLPGGGWDVESPTNYLNGLSRIVIGEHGGGIDVPFNRSAGVRQTLMQDSAWTGTVRALRKCGLGTLSLQRVPRFKGEVDIQAGRVEQMPQTQSFLSEGILFAYDFAESLTQDASGNGYNTQVKTVIAPSKVVNGSVAGRTAATFNKNDYLLVSGSNWDQIGTFTINVWTYFSAWQTVNQQKTLLGNLTQTTTPGAHEYLLRVMENGGFRIIATGEDKVAFGGMILDVTNAVSLNTWCMLSMVVNGTNGITLYVNGQQRPINVTAPAGYGGNRTGVTAFGAGKNWKLTSRASGTIYALGAVSTSEPSGLIGSMSDVQVYTRCLTPAELNQLYAYDFASAPPIAATAVRVRRGAEYGVNGAVQPIGTVSGEGRVTGGRIAVQRTLNPGDSEATVAGAQLSVASLQVGTNVVYRCDWSPDGVDCVRVADALIIDGTGVVDLGLDAASPLPKVPRYQTIPVMTYGSISNAANLATWTVQGTGLRSSGYRASVEAVNNQVVVKTEVFSGMVLIVK